MHRLLDKHGNRVSALVIYANKNSCYQPDGYNYCLLNTRIRLDFASYNIIDQKEDELLNSNNDFALIILVILWSLQMSKKNKPIIFEKVLNLIKTLSQRRISKQKTYKILRFIKLYLNFGNQLQPTIDKTIDSLIIKTKTMGIIELEKMWAVEEGEKRGRELEKMENKTDFVTKLLQESDFSMNKIARLADVSLYFVQSVKRKMRLGAA